MKRDIGKTFKPGDPPPDDYRNWHLWAEVQHRAGLKQEKCSFCSRWKFPQELSGDRVVTRSSTSRGLKVNKIVPICKECAKKEIE